MQIGLTQKLQNFVKRELATVDMNSDPFYSWTAGLGYLDHHKYVFVVNDATRCGFVLCALKAKDLKNLEGLILNGIREMLEPEDNWEFDFEKEEESERNMTIKQLLEKADQMTYYYDFGDGWEMNIKLVRIDKNCTEMTPVCIAAIGDAPPEDAGGASGFAEIQRLLNCYFK